MSDRVRNEPCYVIFIYANIKDTDQTVHQHSLIHIFDF